MKKLNRDEIRRLLEEEGMTDKEVADELDATPETIKNIRLQELDIRREKPWAVVSSAKFRLSNFIFSLVDDNFVLKSQLTSIEGMKSGNVRDNYKFLRQYGFPISRKVFEKPRHHTMDEYEWLSGRSNSKVILYYLDKNEKSVPNSFEELDVYVRRRKKGREISG